MAEYIDREAFIEDIKTEIINLKLDGMKGTPRPCDELYSFIDRINEQPSADVAPVKHGWWIHDDEWWEFICTSCHKGIGNIKKYKYCPNCGAKMDGEEQ